MRLNINTIDKVYKAKLSSVETMELKGYSLIKELFVDSSGFGQDDEMALTQNQFRTELTALLKEHGSLTAKITNQGQFQVFVGLFKKTNKSKVTKLANNTYDVFYSETKHAIRLHDTDIITFDNGKVILNSGGWQTHTTKARINQYLPTGYNLFQKDFEWFLHDYTSEKIVPFKDGMII